MISPSRSARYDLPAPSTPSMPTRRQPAALTMRSMLSISLQMSVMAAAFGVQAPPGSQSAQELLRETAEDSIFAPFVAHCLAICGGEFANLLAKPAERS